VNFLFDVGRYLGLERSLMSQMATEILRLKAAIIVDSN